MRIGGDTGFMLSLAKGASQVVECWGQIAEGKNELVMSVLSINEFLVHSFKRGRTQEAERMIALLDVLDNVAFIPVTRAIAERSAGYRHGLGIPTVDSVILATFVHERCDLVLTTDAHFRLADEQQIITVQMII